MTKTFFPSTSAHKWEGNRIGFLESASNIQEKSKNSVTKAIFPQHFRPQMRGQQNWLFRIRFKYTGKVKEFCDQIHFFAALPPTNEGGQQNWLFRIRFKYTRKVKGISMKQHVFLSDPPTNERKKQLDFGDWLQLYRKSQRISQKNCSIFKC